ncbi:MAG: diacylglycerol kinase family protein [Paludibacteraceae bacterium]
MQHAIIKFFKGFAYAFAGIIAAIRNERNMKFHLFAIVVVITAGVILRISAGEWAVCALCIGMVIGAEMLNTAIEKLADTVSAERNENIRFVKDVAAGAVLVCAIAAACVGLIIFVPKIIALF